MPRTNWKATKLCSLWSMLDYKKDRKVPFPLGEQMKVVCKKCGTDEIQQQGTIMLNPNDLERDLDWNSVEWDKFYYCMECEVECSVKEVE